MFFKIKQGFYTFIEMMNPISFRDFLKAKNGIFIFDIIRAM